MCRQGVLGGARGPTALALLAAGAAALSHDEGAAAGHKGWVLGQGGETCQQACLRLGHACSEDHWPKEMKELKALVSELQYPCKQYQEGSIRYDPSATGPYCGWLGDLRNRPHHRCTAKPPISANRFCYCGAKVDVDALRAQAAAEEPVIDVEIVAATGGTTPPPFDCKVGYHNRIVGWSVYKMVWCCREKNIGCEAGTPAPYDCDAGYENWRFGWSYNKSVWCCEHKGHGCPRTTLAPTETTTTLTTAPASNNGFDCEAGLSKWEKDWSEAKKSWCCLHHERGCHPKFAAPTFDCEAGYDRWELVWSVEKKFWCCRYKHRGCSYTSEPFDCAAGYEKWRLGWSSPKKEWCCAHKQRGCTSRARFAARNADSTTIPTTATVTTSITSTTVTTATTTSTLLFDCDAGFANWVVGWSDEKKVWCCHHEQKGCPTTTTEDVFDCQAGLWNFVAGWSSTKKEWCCEHERLGCPVTTTTLAFDCTAGFVNWVAGWSAEKKEWCCANQNVGCFTTTLADGFDCQAGLANWVAGWSEEKKSWCCEHDNLGCPLGFEANHDISMK